MPPGKHDLKAFNWDDIPNSLNLSSQIPNRVNTKMYFHLIGKEEEKGISYDWYHRREKIDNSDFIQLSGCPNLVQLKLKEKQLTGKEIFATGSSDQSLLFKLCKKLIKFIRTRTISPTDQLSKDINKQSLKGKNPSSQQI